jgi:hypothetical protein
MLHQQNQLRATDKLLDSAEVAAIVGCHPETVTRARRSGKLRGHYLGRRMVRYRLEDVNLWLDNSRHLSPPASHKRPANTDQSLSRRLFTRAS